MFAPCVRTQRYLQFAITYNSMKFVLYVNVISFLIKDFFQTIFFTLFFTYDSKQCVCYISIELYFSCFYLRVFNFIFFLKYQIITLY